MINSFTILQQGSTYTCLWQPPGQLYTAAAGTGGAAYSCWATISLLPHQQAELQAAVDATALLPAQLAGQTPGQGLAQLSGQGRQASRDANQPLLRVGRLLFSLLLPPALQEQIRRLPPGSPLWICTNDTELPWELLHDDQDFLALRHVVSRRLLSPSSATTQAAPPAESFKCLLIGNPNGDLLAADAEVDDLLDLLETAPQGIRAEFACREHATKVRVMSALASGEYDLIHFACHARPGALRLADGWLEAAEIQAVLRGRPLVVLNACSSSRTRMDVTPKEMPPAGAPAGDLGGSLPGAQQVHSLAQAFLVGGAPVFLGAAWPVDDIDIRRLAIEFYRALLGGHALGAALRQARLHSQRRAAQAPYAGGQTAGQTAAWAAPVLYGDPLFRLPQPPVHRQPGTILTVRVAAAPEPTGASSPEAHARSAQQLANQMLAVAVRHGGEVIAIRPDALRVLFGVPHLVEDDADRAMRAALEIRPLVARSGGTCAIAVASGEITTAALGPSTEDEGEAAPLLYLGPLFAEADSLLRQGQPGQVLANERAHQLAEDGFVFVPRMTHGDYDSVLYYEVADAGEAGSEVGPETAPGTALAAAPGTTGETHNGTVSAAGPGFVRRYTGGRGRHTAGETLGRERELSLLTSWWQSAAQGRGQVVGIVGEAGVGKTRLLQEYRQALAAQSHDWIQLSCTSTGRDTPYSLAAQLLRQVFEILPSDGDEVVAAKIEQGLAALPGSPHSADPQVNLILRETLGLSTSNVDEDERRARRGRLVNVLRTMMASAAQQLPLIIAIDDLHWIDDASYDLLAQMIDGISRLRVQFVVLYRPEWQHGWFDKAYYRHLPVDQLDQAAAYNLLHALLGGAELPKGLGVLLQKTGGNPFFIEEMVKALQESGTLVRRTGAQGSAGGSGPVSGPGSAGGWELRGPLTEQQLPGTVERTLRVRLASLTPPTRAVLETAAVIGHQFSLQLLRRLLADPEQDGLPEELETALAELEGRGFVEANWDMQEYQFRHALIQDAVGQTMTPAQHQAWHRRIAELLEEQGGEVEKLAHHLYNSLLASRPAEPPRPDPESSAAQVQKAVDAMLECGRRALLRYAAHEATTYYRRVLLLTPLLRGRDDDNVAGREGIGDALTLLGSFDEAYEELRHAYAALHTRPLDHAARRRAADLTRRIGRVCAWRGRHEEALAWTDEGLHLLGEPQDDADRAIAALLHVHKGSVEYNRGSLEEAARDCGRGLEIARSVGSLLPAEAEAHNMLAILAWAGGHIPEALVHYEQSRAGWLALSNGYQVARVEANMGVAYFYLGEWEEAQVFYNRSREYLEQIDDRDMLAHPYLNLGNINLYQGDWEQAELNFRRALALWSTAHHVRFQALCHTNLGLLAIEQGEWVKALAQLEESYAILTEYKIRDMVSEVLSALAEIALGTGDLPRAAELAAEARAAAVELAMQHEEGLALRILGRVRLAEADLAAARADLQAAHAIFQAMANRYEAARTLYHLACVELAAGYPSAAAEALNQAQAAFTALGARHDRMLVEAVAEQLVQGQGRTM
ncbi:MAG: CHAT domain-containing protein [Caldilineaceae bacterium]